MTITASTPVIQRIRLDPKEIAFYQSDGYLLLPEFVSAEHVQALREEVLDVLEANGVSRAQVARSSATADKLRQNTQYLAGSKLDAMINGEATLDLASQIVGGRAVVYMPFTAVKAAQGGGAFHMHQDNSYTQHEPAMGSTNIWVALVDMTPENGCLCVAPRSHGQGQLASRDAGDGDAHREVDHDPDLVLPIRMRAGDAIAFSRWTVHGSGPNTTDSPRVAYALQYHREDVKALDKQTGQWMLLAKNPRWRVGPVKKLGPADG